VIFSEMLEGWILDALKAGGGELAVIDVHKYVWDHRETELRQSGDHFYKWQYEIRWAAQNLRDKSMLFYPRRGFWALSNP
jgi:hypothetical protein